MVKVQQGLFSRKPQGDLEEINVAKAKIPPFCVNRDQG